MQNYKNLRNKFDDVIINNNSSIKRVDIDALTGHVGMKYPWRITYSSRTGDSINRYFDTYKDFFWEYTNSGGFTEGSLKFHNVSQLENYINRVTPHDNMSINESFNIRVYALQDSAIATISKVYGKNEFFSKLKGVRNYKKGIQTLFNSTGDWELKDITQGKLTQFTKLVFEKFKSVNIITNVDEFKKCIWFPQTFHNIYNLYKAHNSPVSITLPSQSGRNIYDTSTGICGTAPSNTSYKVSESRLFALDDSDEIVPLESDIRDRDYFYHKTIIRIYLLVNSANQNEIAFIIKPVGEDVFRLSYINQSKRPLHIYAYVTSRYKQAQFHRLDGVSELNNLAEDESWAVRKKDLISLLTPGNSKNSISYNSVNNISFFYMNDDGVISSFSTPIKNCIKKSGAKWYLLVSK